MSAFDPLYQSERIKELADEIADAYVSDDFDGIPFRLDMIGEAIGHIEDKIGVESGGQTMIRDITERIMGRVFTKTEADMLIDLIRVRTADRRAIRIIEQEAHK